jgi:hypothetical protein
MFYDGIQVITGLTLICVAGMLLALVAIGLGV